MTCPSNSAVAFWQTALEHLEQNLEKHSKFPEIITLLLIGLELESDSEHMVTKKNATLAQLIETKGRNELDLVKCGFLSQSWVTSQHHYV